MREVKLSSSPRAWGCFLKTVKLICSICVFPTCVGVFLSEREHMINQVKSSPRAWGCFKFPGCNWGCVAVFPTCVGVFPERSGPRMRSCSLPHVRGGVSYFFYFYLLFSLSSPRAWGCFPGMAAELIPGMGLPHVRGGVSSIPTAQPDGQGSSPRAWGCFRWLSPPR